MEQISTFLVYLLYLILCVFICMHFINKKHNKLLKLPFTHKIKHSAQTMYIPLSSIRNQYFPDEINYRTFFINKRAEEAFNILVRLSPSMLSTLSKVETRMEALKDLVDNPSTTEEMIKAEIFSIDPVLNELTEAVYDIVEKINDLIEYRSEDIASIQISSELVGIYMTAVNTLTALTETHSTTNFVIRSKLLKKYPSQYNHFRRISGKLTYILFIDLITCSNRLDENLFISKWSDK